MAIMGSSDIREVYVVMKSERIQECTILAEEILKNIELSEIPIKNIVLKGLRLCRLLGDEEGVLLFTFESSGYSGGSDNTMTGEAWEISKLAGRRYWKKDGKDKNIEYAHLTLLAEIEISIEVNRERLNVAFDPNISVSSANPNEYVSFTRGQSNAQERHNIINIIKKDTGWLEKIKGSLYQYILNIYNRLKYGNVIEDIFTSNRIRVNDQLSQLCPEAIAKFVSVYDNIDSSNPEDWANAVHSCRRIIKEVADKLYPSTDEILTIGKKTIELTDDKYINRLIQFIESKSSSKTYNAVVGSTLASIGERIDAINDAVCKGTHTEITQEEAQRYIIYTYLLLSDILSLHCE